MPLDVWFILKSIIRPTLEITILWIMFYRILVFFEGTRAFHVLKGIMYLLVVFVLAQILHLETLSWLLTKFFGLSIIAFLIIFQPELRHGLARLGQQHLFSPTLEESEMVALIEEITSAIYKLSRKKVGCLIAIERETKLKTYLESGLLIDAKASSEILQSIFTTASPLHDGGVIIQGERIVAASCLFPLSDNQNFSKLIGTRHRAALGLTEQTDAVVIMVSEETAEISVALEGGFVPIANRERLVALLKDLLITHNKKIHLRNRKDEKVVHT